MASKQPGKAIGRLQDPARGRGPHVNAEGVGSRLIYCTVIVIVLVIVLVFVLVLVLVLVRRGERQLLSCFDIFP